MLLRFQTKNYKSFCETMCFDMNPAPKQHGLDYSIIQQKAGKKQCKALSCAVIYGPNAAGKTNIIGAMELLQSLIAAGNINNNTQYMGANEAIRHMDLIPNKDTEHEPVEFLVEFTEAGILFQYELAIDLGSFLQEDYDRRVTRESLTVNGYHIFTRENNELRIENISSIKSYLIEHYTENAAGIEKIAKSNINEKELFLTNNFKILFSAQLVQYITEWFKKKLMVIYRADCLETTRAMDEGSQKKIVRERLIDEAAKKFGVNSNELLYYSPDGGSKTQLGSHFKIGKEDIIIPAETFESFGTIRFINLLPWIAITLKNGGTLVIDEFDASIHPMALLSILNIFHNDEINKRGAQLIFNTHNPIFLNRNVLRRDEIKFVERKQDQSSRHYSLSDFGTSGTNGVRKVDDYMKNYFINQYGAIQDIDFSDIFLKVMEGETK